MSFGLPALPRPGSSPLWGGGEAAPHPCLLPSRHGGSWGCGCDAHVCGGTLTGLVALSGAGGTPGPVSPHHLRSSLPALQDDYIKSWEDNQPGDEGTAGAALGWGAGGSVTASMGGGGGMTHFLPAPPWAFPFRLGAAAGPVRAGKRQLVPRRPPSCSLNGALCRAGWRPAPAGLPRGSLPAPPTCPGPSLPPPQPWTPPRTPARR